MTDTAARAAIAAVWLHQGLWRKLLRGGDQTELVARVPLLGARATAVVRAIGFVEVVLAAWTLSARRPMAAASAQTALLLAMNAGGLLWGRSHIDDPADMVLRNLTLLLLTWRVARPRARR